MSRWKILLNKVLWKHIGILAGIGILLLILTFTFLNIYTHHGQGKPIPDFTGLTELQLQKLFKNNHLRYVIVDSIHTDNVPRGTVVEQVPKAGQTAKKNRLIFITINAWTEEKVAVPNLADYSLRNARAILESFGLTTGELVYIPSEYTNLVLGQHLNGKPVEPGSLVPKGTPIDLLIGRGLSSETTSIPSLIGLDLLNSRRIAQGLYLNIGAIIYDDGIITQEDSLKAFVWKQNPPAEPGYLLNLGSSIDVWLTLDEARLSQAAEEIPADTLRYEEEFR